MKYKFYEFKHTEGTEIILAENENQATNYFINEYSLDSEGNFEREGLAVRRLELEEITEKRKIFNEGSNTMELVSYFDLAAEANPITLPKVIVCPIY